MQFDKDLLTAVRLVNKGQKGKVGKRVTCYLYPASMFFFRLEKTLKPLGVTLVLVDNGLESYISYKKSNLSRIYPAVQSSVYHIRDIAEMCSENGVDKLVDID